MEPVNVPELKESFNWMVCHDGSDASKNVLHQVRWSLMVDKLDHLTVAHVQSAEKETYLEARFKRDAIQQESDTAGIALPNRYHWVCESLDEQKDKDPNASAKKILTGIAGEKGVDVICVGYHGRKGKKGDPTVMGSAVQYLSVNSWVPIFILKEPIDRKDKEDGTYTFACAIDGSEESLKAIPYICQIREKNDKVIVITCEQDNINTEHIQDVCTTLFEELGCKDHINFQILPS